MTEENNSERMRRWRLILGGGSADGIGSQLSKRDEKMDSTLAALYGTGKNEGLLGKSDGDQQRSAGLGSSMPNVSRWLGDIREYFPASVVQVMQQDAIDRIGLQQFLTEPDIFESLEPDVNLIATLVSLRNLIPNHTRDTARIVVRKVVEDLMRKLENPMRQAVSGSLNRAIRNHRPRHQEIDWNRTIRANLKHFQRDYQSIIPEHLV
ncbi:MAG TPA: hypothetical protein VJZ27_02230, partial [Aggregatilineales bacterium]|nr:hypothetical protein [Aggregatilineales bacterium]